MAPLNGTLPLDERQHRAMPIAEELHLDVTRAGNTAFEVDRRVAERRLRLRARGTNRARYIGGARHDAHSLAAAACHRFDHDRVADALSDASDGRVGHVDPERLLCSWHDRDTGLHRRLARGGLAAHQGDRFGRRSDERQSRIAACRCEAFVLGKKAVARMDGIGAGAAGGIDQAIDPQVALRRRVAADVHRLVGKPDVARRAIAIGIDGDRADPHVAAGADDANRDLAAIRNKNLIHGPVP